MENKERLFQTLADVPIKLGAYKASIIDTEKIVPDRAFRDMCAMNSCGMYGKCWMCPPDIGEADVLMADVKKYRYALVYQTVSALEDSYDFEGMTEAKRRFYPLSQKLRDIFRDMNIFTVLHLGAGGCGVCKPCSKAKNEPCRFPDLAMSSLEAYGINVSALASVSGMKYVNGQNTVTYFGAVLFSLGEDGK